MAQVKTMRSRLLRMILVISGLTGALTFATVVTINVQTSSRHLESIQQHIEEGIVSKGKVLTHNHALALRSLILDNAFLDMQRLVQRAVRKDDDLVYGIFINVEREVLAFDRAGQGPPSDEPFTPAAAESLGLSAMDLAATDEVVSRVSRFGQDLLEVAVPVRDDDGQSLGTIRYGLSTHRMREALSRAETERNSALLTSVAWIAALIGLTTAVGLLSSRVQAFRITHPISELTQAARRLATGDRTVRVSIASGDELELLGSSFNHMVEELAGSYRELEQMNRTLEQKVAQRTLELGLRNRDMRLVLDNVDQGFVTLSPDGRMLGGRSRVLGEWFGECQDNLDFGTYIRSKSPAFAHAFSFAWTQLTEGILPLDLVLDQLPAQLAAGGRTWSIRYLPVMEGETLEGVLVVVAEITERLAHEREEAEQRELMQSFTKLMLDRQGFLNFLRDADRMVLSICSRDLETDPVSLKRALHTLKGNASVMGLTLVASLCHTLEDQIGQGTLDAKNLHELSERWRRINAHVLQFVPTGSERAIEVHAAEYAALIAKLSEDKRHSELLAQVLSWGLEPAVRPLERLAEQARALGARLGKGQIDVIVQAGNVRLDPDEWNPFFAELVHVVRNAVDHGIEDPEERAKRAKPPLAKLVLGVRDRNGALVFEVSDDGKGIDWELIRAKAAQRGLRHETMGDLLEALCRDGISTRSEVTETSGRGVGMAAFKHCVQRMNGRIEVKSSGLGTTWLVSFPPRMQRASRRPPLPAAVEERV